MPVRFTPDELKALVESGELHLEDAKLLDPADQQLAIKLLIQSNNQSDPGFKQGIMPAPPFGGARNLGRQARPIGPPNSPTPSNLVREGNVTNPLLKTGSPSVPSGPVENPLEQPRWKGPMGNEDNWRTLGQQSQPVSTPSGARLRSAPVEGPGLIRDMSQNEQNKWGALKRVGGLTDKSLPGWLQASGVESAAPEGATVEELLARLKRVLGKPGR